LTLAECTDEDIRGMVGECRRVLVFQGGRIRYPSRKRVNVVAKQELGGRIQSKSSNKILNGKEFVLDVLCCT